MGDTTSFKIYKKTLYLKHLSRSRYGSTEFSRLKDLMKKTNTHLTAANLRTFFILRDLTEDQLEQLAQSVDIQTAKRRTRIIERGSEDDSVYLLLSGTIELVAEDGRKTTIEDSHSNAKTPISQLIPRKYDVIALTPIQYLKLDKELLPAQAEAADTIDNELLIAEEQDDNEWAEGQLCFALYEDINTNQLILPTLPDIAIQIRKAIKDKVSDAGEVAAIIQTDPAITAKLMRAANSALYAGRLPINTCLAAVVRLGLDTTQKLVLSFSMQELFKSQSKVLQLQMRQALEHSIKISALCYLLARRIDQFDAEEAMLAGLLHDIGVVAILCYAEMFIDPSSDHQQISNAITRFRSQISGMILRQWEFPAEIIDASVEAENWERDPSRPLDYADLIIVAQRYCLEEHAGTGAIPAMEELSSFKKLLPGKSQPEEKLALIHEIFREADQLETLLQSK